MSKWNCPSCNWTKHNGEKCLCCGRPFDPTPEEIAAACLELQKTWSKRGRWQRTAGAYRPVRASVTELPSNDKHRIDRTGGGPRE